METTNKTCDEQTTCFTEKINSAFRPPQKKKAEDEFQTNSTGLKRVLPAGWFLQTATLTDGSARRAAGAETQETFKMLKKLFRCIQKLL